MTANDVTLFGINDIREEDIDNCVLIEEIEKRPRLYKKKLKDYMDVTIKKRLWTQVCERLFLEKWERLTEQQKINTGTGVQRRWKNIRSCFSRELRNTKCTKSGQAAVKRRKYIYFDQLLFLIPHMDNRATGSNAAPLEEGLDDLTENDVQPEGIESMTMPPRTKNRKKNYEESLLQILKTKKVEERDPDTHFALSLVPMLKDLSADEKLDAQIQILQVFKSVRQQYSVVSYSPANSMQNNSYSELPCGSGSSTHMYINEEMHSKYSATSNDSDEAEYLT